MVTPRNLKPNATGIDVTGHTETDTLNVSGLSTFAGNIDANGNLDVDGHTELDDVNISGVATATLSILEQKVLQSELPLALSVDLQKLSLIQRESVIILVP